MKKISETKKEKLNDYIAIYLNSDLTGKKNLKLEIYSLDLDVSQKDALWLTVVRSSKI